MPNVRDSSGTMGTIYLPICLSRRRSPSKRTNPIVVDLRGAIIDEAFGAAALERIVETAERWDAETLFAGPSPLSERVIDELERPPLMVIKDLHEAIALGFQIARSQRAVA